MSSATRRGKTAAAPSAPAWPRGAVTEPLQAVARQLRGWTDTVLGLAGPAAELAIGVARAKARNPAQKALITRAGSALKRMRESAGLTLADLAQAIDLGDPALLEAAEGGKAALPFELVLRLGGVLGRSDPLAATMKLARAYNPELWQALESLGVGRLVVQAGRERELANVYRANDAARRLNDEDFAVALEFTKSAFDMAVGFRLAAAPTTSRASTRTQKKA